MFLLMVLVWACSDKCVASVVDSPSGRIQGFEKSSRDGRGYLAWTRIPYAKPPVGELRLAAPEPLEKWDDVLNATTQPPMCPQPMGMSVVGQEDCLYLNIFKPKIDTTKPLPVLVYIHGGSFKWGNSGPPNAADYIMDEDIVLVSVAYRLGKLGFMSMNDPSFPGNYGLKDQALALKWIKNNIEAFGGDSNSITVMGISAGGASSHELLLSPLTKDIVSKAICISGITSKAWGMRTGDDVVKSTLADAKKVGCPEENPQSILECLRGKTLTVLASDSTKLTKIQTLEFGPIIEPDSPDAFAPYELTQTESTKPLLVGYSAGEFLLFEIPLLMLKRGTKEDIDEAVVTFLNLTGVQEDRLPQQVEILKKEYFNGSSDDATHSISKMMADGGFVYQALTASMLHKGPKWLYHMEFRGELSLTDFLPKKTPEKLPIPCHGDEFFLLFNGRDEIILAKPQPDPEDTRVSKEFIKYLVNFAYHDNPTPDESGFQWKPFGGGEILRIKSGQNVMADDAFVQEQFDIRRRWADIFGTNAWYK